MENSIVEIDGKKYEFIIGDTWCNGCAFDGERCLDLDGLCRAPFDRKTGTAYVYSEIKEK